MSPHKQRHDRPSLLSNSFHLYHLFAMCYYFMITWNCDSFLCTTEPQYSFGILVLSDSFYCLPEKIHLGENIDHKRSLPVSQM